jgi:hypothetical protein
MANQKKNIRLTPRLEEVEVAAASFRVPHLQKGK